LGMIWITFFLSLRAISDAAYPFDRLDT
jgi:hypothetical protein